MANRKAIPRPDQLPRTMLVQVTIPFGDGMLLEKLAVKRKGDGVKPSHASKPALIGEAIRKLAASEGVTYTPGEAVV